MIGQKQNKSHGLNPLQFTAVTIALCNLILISLSAYFYHGRVQFWALPLSELGTKTNVWGNVNIISSRLFTADLIITGYIFGWLAANFYARKNRTTHNLFYTIALSAACIGLIVCGLWSDDVNHYLHLGGIAVAVTALWLFLTVALYRSVRKTSPVLFYALELTLQISLGSYELSRATNHLLLSYALQKIMLIVILLILLILAAPKISPALHESAD